MRMLEDFRKDNNGSDEAVSLSCALFSSMFLQWLTPESCQGHAHDIFPLMIAHELLNFQEPPALKIVRESSLKADGITGYVCMSRASSALFCRRMLKSHTLILRLQTSI